MSTQPLIHRLLPSAGRTAFVAAVLLAVSVPSLWAKLTPAQAAAAAASGTIQALIAEKDPNFAADAGTAIDSIVDQNPSVGGVAVDAALGTISDAIVAASSGLSDGTLLAGDQAIGKDLTKDATLEALPSSALSKILKAGIAGINGVKGKSQATAPEAAQSFVAGIVDTGSLPDVTGTPAATDYASFAVTILAKVNKNSSVDELAANAVAMEDVSDPSGLSTALFTAYPKAAIKLTQGILAATAPTSAISDSGRVTVVGDLTTASVKNAVSIAEGAALVDPFYAGAFTNAVLGNISTPATLNSDAGKIAKSVGKVLGQDGNVLASVAGVYGDLLSAGTLPAASASTYASNLIKGALSGLPASVPVSVYTPTDPMADGGKLTIGTATAQDIASILDLLANGISSSSSAAKQIGLLFQAVANITKGDTVTPDAISSPYTDSSVTGSVPFPVYLAGTLASDIASVDPSLGAAVNAAIQKAVALDSKAIKTGVKALFATGSTTPYTDYLAVGAIAVQETVVTNL